MSKNNKYGKIDQGDLLRYIHGEMSDEDRHALERSVQKDLFASDALDGLSEHNIEQVRDDLERLEKKLNKRVSGGRSSTWIRIAASVAVLLTIGTLYFTVFDDMLDRTGKIALETESSKSAREKAGEQDVQTVESGQAPKGDQKEESNQAPEDDQTPAPAKIIEQVRQQEPTRQDQAAVVPSERSTARDDSPTPAESPIASQPELSSEVADSRSEGSQDTLFVTESEIMADQELAMSIVEFEEESLANDEIVLESPNSETKARATSPAVSEVSSDQVAGAVAKKEAAARSVTGIASVRVLSDSTSATPVGGMALFRQYIINNLRYPEAESAISNAAVVLNFRLDPQGKPQEINVEETTGVAFTGEALRLLQEGPAWTPAVVNGIPVESTTRLRLDFTKQ